MIEVSFSAVYVRAIHKKRGERMLESSRLILRPLSIYELKLIHIHRQDEITPVLDAKAVTDAIRQAISKKIEKMSSMREKDHPWLTYWLIIEKESDTAIGFIGLKGRPDENGLAEVGYGISENCRRKGYMVEALVLFIDWAKSFPGCKGITAMNVLKENTGSQRVLAKCNFQLTASNEETNDYMLLFHQ